MAVVNKYKHDIAIKKIFAEPYGMSVAFIDDKSEGYIYNPVNSNIIKIPNLPATTQGIVWETFEQEKVKTQVYLNESSISEVFFF